MQKTAPKNTKYSRNESIFKISYVARGIAHAKAIAFAKWLLVVKSSKCQKHAGKPFYKNIGVVLCEKLLEKTRNIREIR